MREDEIQTPTIGRTLRSDALGKKIEKESQSLKFIWKHFSDCLTSKLVLRHGSNTSRNSMFKFPRAGLHWYGDRSNSCAFCPANTTCFGFLFFRLLTRRVRTPFKIARNVLRKKNDAPPFLIIHARQALQKLAELVLSHATPITSLPKNRLNN